MGKLGYDYEDMTPYWTRAMPITSRARTRSATTSRIPVNEFGPGPSILKEAAPIRALVKRPRSSRGASEVEENVEVLIIDGVEIEPSSPNGFNVYVAKPYGKFAGSDYGEFAGSFATVPHGHGGNEEEEKVGKFRMKLGITELIKEIGAETSESLVVTLVTTLATEIIINGIHIEQVKSK